MACKYVIKYRGRKLNIFNPNDLPTRTKNGICFTNIISFSNNEYMIFDSFEEAQNYVFYMLKEVKEEHNYKRYNQVHPYADSELINIIGKLKIYMEN